MNSQRQGSNFLLDLDKSRPNFESEYANDDIFRADLFFNYPLWHEESVHLRFVKKEETYARGAPFSGIYFMQDDWTLNIRSACDTIEDLQK